ncbi:5'-methylthioadenosine/S-adenosylhomocysteine nucleosidase family protein [Aspergillus undulatus]|uniref:5'-methylthioadenosine/S-adenosylhomocysteine nucleosidase family protein n=1 Tax=Aspergillus undulatus TaxID=1810928 RepID=UPI003CCDC7A6
MKRPRPQLSDYTVGLVCALPVELAAALKMFDEEHEDLTPELGEANLCTLGRRGGHNVAIAYLPAGRTGTNPAAVSAARIKAKFKSIRFGLMVGIGGGVPGREHDIRLGDVTVSEPRGEHGGVVQYDFGKSTASGFVRTGSLNAPPNLLLQGLAKLKAHHRIQRSTFGTWPRLTCDDCEKDQIARRTTRGGPSDVVHYGTIASGNQVIRDDTTRVQLSRELGEVLCFDMEAAGLLSDFPCLAIRGVSDYADSHKNKQWQPYAATTAAAYAKELLSVIPTDELPSERTFNETTDNDIIQD